MMKYTLPLLGSLLLAGAVNAQLVALDVAAVGSYTNDSNTTVTTTGIVASDGATFDLTYTLGSIANGANPFANSTGALYGVGSDTDIANHYNTLEGNDGEGLSFTNLTLSNFSAGSTYTEQEFIDSLTFSSFSVGAAGNVQDGVNVSYASFGADTDNEALNDNGALNPTVTLAGRTNFVAAGSSATSLYLQVNSTGSKNRWSVSGLDVSFVPEPSSYALLAGILGLTFVMLRRRQA
ncbi:PEP-CTERM sorting domain-containing protein [bacterium]|nr:PEP-CTERM sorting domain-containing protein [bacterium]